MYCPNREEHSIEYRTLYRRLKKLRARLLDRGLGGCAQIEKAERILGHHQNSDFDEGVWLPRSGI